MLVGLLAVLALNRIVTRHREAAGDPAPVDLTQTVATFYRTPSSDALGVVPTGYDGASSDLLSEWSVAGKATRTVASASYRARRRLQSPSPTGSRRPAR